jgi:hypothetical protein
MIRNWFVREEGAGLVLASGLPEEWLAAGERMRLGPTPTPFGPITVEIEPGADGTAVQWTASWRGAEPPIEVRLPGREAKRAAPGERSVRVARGGAGAGGRRGKGWAVS